MSLYAKRGIVGPQQKKMDKSISENVNVRLLRRNNDHDKDNYPL